MARARKKNGRIIGARLLVAIMVGGVSSHMPGRYRYYSLLHGRDVGHGGKG